VGVERQAGESGEARGGRQAGKETEAARTPLGWRNPHLPHLRPQKPLEQAGFGRWGLASNPHPETSTRTESGCRARRRGAPAFQLIKGAVRARDRERPHTGPLFLATGLGVRPHACMAPTVRGDGQMSLLVIPTNVHGMIGYVASGALYAAPALLGLNDVPASSRTLRLASGERSPPACSPTTNSAS
jgi:hypothetical protein